MFLRRRFGYFIKNLFKFFSYCIFVILYSEVLHYIIVIYQCKWPEVNSHMKDSNSEILRVMAVADTHLLGKRHGHWFDKLRREWQMYRAFQTSITLHNPDLVIFLGDLFDEGKWCSKEEFKSYVKRFHSLFYLPKHVEVLVAAGNHDMGFHYSLNPYLVSRFEKAFRAPSVQFKTIKGVSFVVINSMAMHGDEDCFLCSPAKSKIEAIARELRCIQTPNRKECERPTDSYAKEFSKPILVQHYPLYRESDALCAESDAAPPEEKHLKFRERWECLSRESSDMLLRELEPRLVLSGHTHHGCRVHHNYTARSKDEKISTLEYTVASFSWRNKVNPTFAMLSASNDDYNIYKCEIPNENSVILLYVGFFILYLIYLLKKKIKIGNFLYFKFRDKVFGF